ncbi:MAG: OPT family oligopeptide transporter [Phycisphaerales bacterium]
MAIQQLSEEQVRTMTLEEKDRWWLANVFKGNMPQLTIRSALTGFILGGLLSATNLYIGAKTGWSLGVGVTSVILAFALFKIMQRIGLAREFTILENNAMQSIATAAGYMTAPLISSLTAYMMVSNQLLPWHQIITWNIVISILGVLFAFPLKRRFINDEQHPFPEGRAAGVVMDTLHSSDASVGMMKARAMLWAAGIAAACKFIQAEGIQEWIQHKMLKLEHALGWFPNKLIHLPEQLDVLYVWFAGKVGLGIPKLGGIDFRQCGVTPALDISLMGAGGLMGIRGGFSLLVGAILNYCILAPWMINRGDIKQATNLATGELRFDALGNAVFGFRQVTFWSLWPGVACLVVASFVAFFAKPKVIMSSFRGLFGKRDQTSDVLKHIELPNWVPIIGIPVFSLIAALLGNAYFGVPIWACLVGLPLTFVLTLVAANSTALTSTTPVGATSKITQLFYGVVTPKDIKTNIATASITAEVVSNASNLLMDIKPGYMLGAKPRQQAIGHVIGIFAGAIASTPLFFLLFTTNVAEKGVESIQSDKFPMPAVTIWRAVAEALTKGLGELAPSVQYAVVVGALIGLALEITRIATRGKFLLSPIGLGLAFVINFQSAIAMFLGAFFFWLMGVGRNRPESAPKSTWIENHEPICAGVIAGAALMGIADAVITAFVLPLYN